MTSKPIDLRSDVVVEHGNDIFAKMGSFWTGKSNDAFVSQVLAGAVQDRLNQAQIRLKEDIATATNIAAAPLHHVEVWRRLVLFENDIVEEHPNTPYYQESTGFFGAGLVFGQGVPTVWSWRLEDSDLSNPTCVANTLTDQTYVSYKNHGFFYDKNVLGLRVNPFADPRFNVVNTENGRAVTLWLRMSKFDTRNVSFQYGVPLGVPSLPSSESYRKLCEGAWEARVRGPSNSALYKIIAGATGVPLCESDGEVVEVITVAPNGDKVVVTNKKAYRFPGSHVVTVSVGDTLQEGQEFTDALKIRHPASMVSGQEDITITPPFFHRDAGIKKPIRFPNARVNVEPGGLDAYGNREIKFLLHGDGADLKRYRKAANKAQIYKAFDIRGPSAPTMPSPSQIKATVNPAIDLVARHTKPHLILVYGDAARWPARPEQKAMLVPQANKAVPPHGCVLLQPEVTSASESSQSYQSSSSSSFSNSRSSQSTSSRSSASTSLSSRSSRSTLSTASTASSVSSVSTSSVSTWGTDTSSSRSPSSGSSQSPSSRSTQSRSSRSSVSLSSNSSRSSASTDSSSSTPPSQSTGSTQTSASSSSSRAQNSTSSFSESLLSASTDSSSSAVEFSTSSRSTGSSQSTSRSSVSPSSNSSSSNSSSSRSNVTMSTQSSRSESSVTWSFSTRSSMTTQSESSRTSRSDSSRSKSTASSASSVSSRSPSSVSEVTNPPPQSQSSNSSPSSNSTAALPLCGRPLRYNNTSQMAWSSHAFYDAVTDRTYIIRKFTNTFGVPVSVNVRFFVVTAPSGFGYYIAYYNYDPCQPGGDYGAWDDSGFMSGSTLYTRTYTVQPGEILSVAIASYYNGNYVSASTGWYMDWTFESTSSSRSSQSSASSPRSNSSVTGPPYGSASLSSRSPQTLSSRSSRSSASSPSTDSTSAALRSTSSRSTLSSRSSDSSKSPV